MINSLEDSVVNKFTGEHPCRSVISIKLLFGSGFSLVNLVQFAKQLFLISLWRAASDRFSHFDGHSPESFLKLIKLKFLRIKG